MCSFPGRSWNQPVGIPKRAVSTCDQTSPCGIAEFRVRNLFWSKESCHMLPLCRLSSSHTMQFRALCTQCCYIEMPLPIYQSSLKQDHADSCGLWIVYQLHQKINSTWSWDEGGVTGSMPRVTCKPVQSAMSGLSMGWFLVEYVLVSDSVNETSELQFGEHWRTSESYTILYYHILSHIIAWNCHWSTLQVYLAAGAEEGAAIGETVS